MHLRKQPNIIAHMQESSSQDRLIKTSKVSQYEASYQAQNMKQMQ